MKKILPFLFGFALSFSQGHTLLVGAELPNPASKMCVDLGGSLRSYELEEGGEISLCAFQDEVYLNGLIEEWTLFRYKMPSAEPSMAVTAFFKHEPYKAPAAGPVGHPALRYCLQLGGKRFIIVDREGGESGVCAFEDRSQIEEWTLFRGPDIHRGLTQALQPSSRKITH